MEEEIDTGQSIHWIVEYLKLFVNCFDLETMGNYLDEKKEINISKQTKQNTGNLTEVSALFFEQKSLS